MSAEHECQKADPAYIVGFGVSRDLSHNGMHIALYCTPGKGHRRLLWREMSMSSMNLEKLFAPGSVAVVGASEKPGSAGAAVIGNLVGGGFTRHIYPVNPHSGEIFGRKAYQSVKDLPETPDLAVIATPIHTVPGIVKSCMEKGLCGAVVLSAGGKETGEKGAAIESEICRTIRNSDFRVIGPNCFGIISPRDDLNAGFAGWMPKKGGMAFISQSGAICRAILDFAAREHIGFSYFVSLGSMLDVDFGDMIDYLGGDPSVGSIVMYIENLCRIRNFMSAARAVSRIKPIIALKSGRSAAGAAAAVSHTGALTGEDAIYDAAFKRAGIIRVNTFAELFDCAEFIGKQPGPKGHGLAIVTNAGGPGIMAADALWDYGFPPAALSLDTLKKMDAILPPHWSRSNPVDILDDAAPDRYVQCVDILMQAKEVDGLLIMLVPHAVAEPEMTARDLADLLKKRSYPVFTAWLGGSDAETGRAIFNKAGIPTFDSPERAVRAFMDLYHYSRNIETLQQVPRKLPGRLSFDHVAARQLVDIGRGRKNGLLTETEAKQLLAAYGIPVNKTEVATDAEQAVQVAQGIGYPVVMKIHSSCIVHKSDVGGVVLDIREDEGVRAAFERIRQSVTFQYPGSFAGVGVQKMLPRRDFELIAGSRTDKDFGPVLLFGLGGVLTEVLKDRSIALPPLNRLLARQMIEGTLIWRLLNGYRNYQAVDVSQLESILIRLSHMVSDFAEIAEVDINPLLINEGRVIAVDARVSIATSFVEAPLHLVISPYPNQYEDQIDIEGVGRLTVRPIRPEDAPLLEEMFSVLSLTSVYYRFFNIMKRLPHHMLARYTQIDYDREIAMVAIDSSGGSEKMLGVSRVIADGSMKSAEFAVVVADQWQGKGIGAVLLSRCLDFAQSKNIQKIWAVVMPGNTKMLAMAKKMNFDIKYHHSRGEYELTLDLRRSGKNRECRAGSDNVGAVQEIG